MCRVFRQRRWPRPSSARKALRSPPQSLDGGHSACRNRHRAGVCFSLLPPPGAPTQTPSPAAGSRAAAAASAVTAPITTAPSRPPRAPLPRPPPTFHLCERLPPPPGPCCHDRCHRARRRRCYRYRRYPCPVVRAAISRSPHHRRLVCRHRHCRHRCDRCRRPRPATAAATLIAATALAVAPPPRPPPPPSAVVSGRFLGSQFPFSARP